MTAESTQLPPPDGNRLFLSLAREICFDDSLIPIPRNGDFPEEVYAYHGNRSDPELTLEASFRGGLSRDVGIVRATFGIPKELQDLTVDEAAPLSLQDDPYAKYLYDKFASHLEAPTDIKVRVYPLPAIPTTAGSISLENEPVEIKKRDTRVTSLEDAGVPLHLRFCRPQ